MSADQLDTLGELDPGEALRGAFDAALGDMWERAELDNARSWQLELGMSALGGCEREAGYILAGTPPSDTPPPNRAAVLGTWLHALVLPILGDVFGDDAVVEGEVRLDDLRGHSDLYVTVRALEGLAAAADLKTCTGAAISRAKRYGPRRRHRWQVQTYAAARRQAGERVDYIVIIYLDRGTGEHWVHVEPYDEQAVREAADWLRHVRAVADRNPDLGTRTYRGPGVDAGCDSCRWSTRCYPDGPRSIITTSDEPDAMLELVLGRRMDAADQKTDIDKDAKFYADALAGTPEGDYGPFHLHWKSNGRRLAQKLATERLERHGLEVPYGDESWSPVVTYHGKSAPGRKETDAP